MPNIEIIIENTPLWDDFKNRLFNADNPGAFSDKNFQIGQSINCFSSLICLIDNEPCGIATINMTSEFDIEDMPVNVLELNIAVDKRNKPKACVGKALLNKAEEIAKENGFEEIRGVVKHSNLKRDQVAEWLLNNGFDIENNPFDSEFNKKLIFCKRLFSKNSDITFVKRF